MRGIPVAQKEDGGWDDVPMYDKDILNLAPELRHPKTIEVWINREHPKVMSHGF